MKTEKLEKPRFKSESEEADWWASPAGRAYVKGKSAELRGRGMKAAGSALVAKLNKRKSVQIAIRLPEGDVERAREVAGRKGIGYQTLIKMLVREGLERERRRG
ncbi:MAG: hypothetical protein HY858_01035 [Candidatus Solibacter usitatus]|nr:hypothetical protein [Candidatus Solibacter usitatus]